MIGNGNPQALVDLVWSSSSKVDWVRNTLLVLLGSAFIALSARVQVPMYPVPMTMQTLAVLLVGMTFGRKLGGLTILAYLAEGALGLPVFAAGGGVAYFTGPTAGYLYGFFFSASFVGWLAERGWIHSVSFTFAAMIAGTAIIYLGGVAWLSGFIGVEKALTSGLYPFVFGDIAKAAIAAFSLPMIWARINN